MRLEDKSVLVSGAGGLLGSSFVVACLKEGARVIAVDIDAVALDRLSLNLTERHHKRFLTQTADITSESSVEALFEKIPSEYSPNALVNNAAINSRVEKGEMDRNRLEDISKERWDFEFNVGLWGPFVLSRAFGLRAISNRQTATIVNIGSDYAHIAPNQNIYREEPSDSGQALKPVTYPVMKHGVVGLTRYLSTYWGRSGIRVNTLSPGGIANGQTETFVSLLSEQIPLGRLATSDELSGALVYLLSDESSYVTGTEIIVDGGRQIW